MKVTTRWPRPVLFGCPVDGVSLTQAVQWIEERIEGGVPTRVGAVNAAKLVRMENDPELAHAVSSSDLILADGMSVVWGAWLTTGVRLVRVAGIDLMEALVARAAERGFSIYFLGAKEEVLARMIDILRERHSGLVVAGSHHGYFRPEEEPALTEAIRAANADLVFVAMGTPAKELWMDRHHLATGAAVCMGVGGSFDVIAGEVSRAPGWVQKVGMEWFYRFAQEPRRLWRRYLITSTIYIGKVLARAAARPFGRGGSR